MAPAGPSISLAVHNNTADGTFALYAAVPHSPYDGTYDVFRATDLGSTGSWLAMDPTPRVGSASFVADPNDPNVLFVAGQPKDSVPPAQPIPPDT